MPEGPDTPLVTLLRTAWLRYAAAIREALEAAGYDDLPRSGPTVLSAIAKGERPLAEIVAGLGVTKQAAGALVDTLVSRGYLSRDIDSGDRRRLRVALTDRGRDAARVIQRAARRLDDRLVDLAGPRGAAATRAALAAFVADA